ncbi:hypothetical protein OEZ85_014209 [Tetradesmus obliquus]|uniref:Protein kinase domain-containing protein n=1 Tax=Tetradesmus obliquus TaxID=3088 RepID=A0ABY8UA59_TETOB|nr:hypothetical protein OEZ85_014209 [Tetradesmus obliquus]
MGCIGQGGNAVAYLVRLDNIVKPEAQPDTAAAGCSEARPAEAAAARWRARRLLPGPQVGGLYVFKVCRLLQDSTEEERCGTAVDDQRKYLYAVRKQLLGERACYGRLARSPHFVRCFAYGAATMTASGAAAAPPAVGQERPCLLLEYAQGGSVAALLESAEGGAAGMSAQQARDVMQIAAEALQHCHRWDIVYRDLQPGNIVLSQAPSGESDYKLIDLGSSIITDEGPGTDHRFGMLAYRAPEQRPGSTHTYTLDTWQLGMLLLHLRTGVLPLLELASLPEPEWLAQVSAVH